MACKCSDALTRPSLRLDQNLDLWRAGQKHCITHELNPVCGKSLICHGNKTKTTHCSALAANVQGSLSLFQAIQGPKITLLQLPTQNKAHQKLSLHVKNHDWQWFRTTTKATPTRPILSRCHSLQHQAMSLNYFEILLPLYSGGTMKSLILKGKLVLAPSLKFRDFIPWAKIISANFVCRVCNIWDPAETNLSQIGKLPSWQWISIKGVHLKRLP